MCLESANVAELERRGHTLQHPLRLSYMCHSDCLICTTSHNLAVTVLYVPHSDLQSADVTELERRGHPLQPLLRRVLRYRPAREREARDNRLRALRARERWPAWSAGQGGGQVDSDRQALAARGRTREGEQAGEREREAVRMRDRVVNGSYISRDAPYSEH